MCQRQDDDRLVTVTAGHLAPRFEAVVRGDVPGHLHVAGAQRRPGGTAALRAVVGPDVYLLDVLDAAGARPRDDDARFVALADPRERVGFRLTEPLTDVGFDLLAGLSADQFALDVPDHAVDAFEFGRASLGAVGLDGVVDAVGEQFVLVGAGRLPEVVGDAGRDGLVGDFLAALAGEEDERDVRGVGPHRLQEVEPAHRRHGVIAHDAIDRRRLVLEAGKRRLDCRLDLDVDALVDAFEMGRRQLRNRPFVVDQQDRNPLVHGSL